MTIQKRGLLAAVLGAWLFAAALPALAATEAKQVNINSASAIELETVKGIGSSRAKAIVDHRDKNGPFKSVDDLKNVKGIGEKNLAALRAQITIGDVAANPAPAAANKH